jgi:hypothetical protein
MIQSTAIYGCGCGKPKGTNRPTSLPRPKPKK